MPIIICTYFKASRGLPLVPQWSLSTGHHQGPLPHPPLPGYKAFLSAWPFQYAHMGLYGKNKWICHDAIVGPTRGELVYWKCTMISLRGPLNFHPWRMPVESPCQQIAHVGMLTSSFLPQKYGVIGPQVVLWLSKWPFAGKRFSGHPCSIMKFLIYLNRRIVISGEVFEQVL